MMFGSTVRFAALLCLAALGSACADVNVGEIPEPQGVSATVNPQVPTVVRVGWTTTQPSRGYVEYGATPELGSTTPMQGTAAAVHSMDLFGLTPNTSYFYRVVTWDGDDAAASELGSFSTGPNAVALMPQVAGAGNDQYVVIPVNGATPAVVIAGPAGNVIWARAAQAGRVLPSAQFAANGQGIVYSSVTTPPSDTSEIVRVSLDAQTVTSTVIPHLTGPFAQLPDGTIAAIVSETRESVVGSTLVEVAPGGAPTPIWSTWDCFDPTTHAPGAADWGVATALTYDQISGGYYVNLKSLGSIARVPRTGGCDRVYGESAPTFTYGEATEAFRSPGGLSVFGLRLLVFDEGGSAAGPRVIEYNVDEAAATLTQVLSYPAPSDLLTASGGQPLRVAAGNTLVNWGSAGALELVSTAGASLWRMNVAGASFGAVGVTTSLYAGN